MTRERGDEQRLAEMLGRALSDGVEQPVDTARLLTGARQGARRIRRRRQAGVAVLALVALAGAPAGLAALGPDDGTTGTEVASVATAPPVQRSDPAPDAPTPTEPGMALQREDGRLLVPDEAMLDLDTVREVLDAAGSGAPASWTVDSDPVAGTGWPQRLPCSDGPDPDDVAGTEGLRERGSDDGAGATVYTSVVVYRPGQGPAAWERIASSIDEGTCEGGLVGRAGEGPPDTSGTVLTGSSGDGTIALALRREGDVVVSVRLYSAAGAEVTRPVARTLLDRAAERLARSGFLAAVEAEPDR